MTATVTVLNKGFSIKIVKRGFSDEEFSLIVATAPWRIRDADFDVDGVFQSWRYREWLRAIGEDVAP